MGWCAFSVSGPGASRPSCSRPRPILVFVPHQVGQYGVIFADFHTKVMEGLFEPTLRQFPGVVFVSSRHHGKRRDGISIILDKKVEYSHLLQPAKGPSLFP